MKRQVLLIPFLLSFLCSPDKADGQSYSIGYAADAGNPPGGYVTTDLNTSGTIILGSSTMSTNQWSAVQSIPFNFYFFGSLVTQYKVSANGVLTFDVNSSILPGSNTTIPTSTLPDSSIAFMWDDFTASAPTGSGDYCRVNTYGTAPNRQLWVWYYSYEIGSPAYSYAYFALVLEETTNNIYIVSQYNSTGTSGTTVGVQLNSTTGFMDINSPNIQRENNGTTLTDNDLWTLTPLVPCTAPPDPGNAVASTTTPCPNKTFTLNLNNNSIGSGQTYDWEMSASTPTSFSSASGVQPSTVYPVTAPAVSGVYYYRCKVDCNSNIEYSDTIAITVPAQFPSNTYTINSASPTGGTNFQTFADAANAMKCGIAGPVTFNVSPGTYSYDHFWLDSLNSNATSTITVNGGGATLIDTSTATDYAVIRLNNTSYVTINNLNIIVESGSTAGFGVSITANSDYNTISNCVIQTDSTSTSASFCGIAISGSSTDQDAAGSDCDNNTITGNTIIGGSYGITLVGSSTADVLANTISNNIIRNFYSRGIFVDYATNTLVESNDLTRPGRTNATTTYPIYLSDCESTQVSKNKIHNLFDAFLSSTSSCYPIYMTTSDAPIGSENIFSNNLIYNINNGEGTIYGIYNNGSDNAKYYHNTVVLDDQTVTTDEDTRGFYETGTVSGLEIANNIFYITRTAIGTTADAGNYGIFLNTATSFISNNNDFFITGAARNHVGQDGNGNDRLTLLDWQTNTSQDVTSLDINPVFSNGSSGDYTPFSAALDNMGVYVNINTDILNATRNTSSPDIGAYEFNVPVCSPTGLTAGTASASPDILCSGGSVTFNLSGQSTGAGITFNWQSSTSPNGPFNTVYTGNSGTYTANVFGTEYYRCEIVCGSTTAYSDTIFVGAYSLMGNYTIDQNAPKSATNFKSFTDAMMALNCGLSGPVVFDVVPNSGPYNERIEFPSGLVTSAANTIRINGNGNWLMNAASVSAMRSAVLIDGHDYITIDSLNIDVRGGTYGWGINLINDADYDTISNCTVITDSSSTSSNFMGIILNGSATGYTTAGDNNNTVIEDNTVVGGYYGICSYGSSSETATNNIIRNNNVTETYLYNIYLYYSTNFTIEGNDISRSQRSNVSTGYGIYLSSCNGGGTVNRNRIHNLFGGEPTATSTCAGIYITSSDGTSSAPLTISNNLIYDMTGSSTMYGIYNSGSDYNLNYFNTISLDNTAATGTGTTRGFYQTTSASGLEFVNNIVTVTRGGTGAKHGIYLNDATTISNGVMLSNNVYYVNGAGGSNYIGAQSSSDYNDLTSWQSSFTPAKEVGSAEIDPLYANAGNGNFEPTRMAINDIGIPLAVVTQDINNAVRSLSTPDPGAYEWTPPPCTTPPTAGTVDVSDTLLCQGESVTFSLNNGSAGLGQTFQWQYAATASSSFTNVPGSIPQSASLFTTTPSASGYYRAEVNCSGNLAYSDTVYVEAKTPLAGNTYTVDPSLPSSSTNFTSLQDAMDAMSCGITGPVVINVAAGSGPYLDQQLVFPTTLVTSSANTITINGNGATLVSNCQDADQRAAIAFYGTDYVTINDLVIDASTGAYNWGIFFTQGADHNKIENCTIISSKTATSSAIADAIVFSASNTAATTNGNNGNYDTIINNTIIGGYYGIAMYGASATPSVGNVIENNISQDAYAYNILAVYSDGAIIRGNDVSRPTRTNTGTFAGIYANLATTNIRIEKNRIHNIADAVSSSFTAYCIYLNGADGTAAGHNIVSNNAVYNINGLGARFGVRNSGSDEWSIYHNTISIDDQTANTTDATGIYQTTAATTFNIKDNMISVTRPTTGLNTGIYMNTSTTTFTSDYNNVYIAGGATNNFGQVGTTSAGVIYPTISSWRTGTSQDLMSDTLHPYYANTLAGDLSSTNPLLDNRGTPIAGIIDDILNNPRNVSTPDIGAFEFVPLVCPPPAQLSASNVTGSSADISWAYVNNAPPSLGYEYYYSTNGTTPVASVAPSGFGSTGTMASLSGLSGGTQYYVWVRSICSSTDTSTWSQPVSFRTRPVNDSAINAILLTLGTTVCNGVNYNGDVGGATIETNEPVISCEQTAGTTNSVWYKFDAPASGMVKISTDHAVSAYDSLVDSKLGVYSVTDSSDFSTYQIVGCDDDNGIVGMGYRNILYLADLTPGSRYYIKVDKNNPANPDAAFCIDVMPMTSSMISTNVNCGGTGYSNNSNWHNGKKAWVSMLDNDGLLIYNMKTDSNTTALGAMPNEFYEQSGASRTYNGTPYLNRNYKITSATAPTNSIVLQFFFTDADFISLQNAKPGLTMADLNVTRLSGAACSDTFNPTGQTASLLTQLANGSANGVRFVDVRTPGFSSFFIHADNYPLFIRLEKITAVNMGNYNRIDWNTSSEETGDRFELERSPDGKGFNKIADIMTKGEAAHYSYLDKDARNGVNYYRLKMYDNANRFEYSPIVKAVVNRKNDFAIGAFPNPVNENLTVRVIGFQGTSATVQILDVTGKILKTVSMNGSEETINMSSLASGVYLIKYTDDLHSETVRVTKE